MQVLVPSDSPTVYADMNVFRYLSYGELTIDKPERFQWVYSHVHLDEIRRTGNTDAFDGMKQLRAVEIDDVLDYRFKSIGNIVLREYVDPALRYQQHIDAISGYEDTGELIIELLLRFYGADNFKELSLTPDMLRMEVDRLTAEANPVQRNVLLKQVDRVSSDMKLMIEEQLQERLPLEQSRSEFGLSSSDRETASKSRSPIDALWEIVKDKAGGIRQAQFFGFEAIPGTENLPRTQDGSIAGAYTVLNLLGLRADTKLAKRDKIKNTISDSNHVGMASYCSALLSADKRLCDKANAIYVHVNSHCSALHFDYDSSGMNLHLEISTSSP